MNRLIDRVLLVAAAGLCAGRLFAWDGQEWVYDTSARVEKRPSVRTGEGTSLSEGRTTMQSAPLALSSVFWTSWWSDDIDIDGFAPGLIIFIR